MALEKLATFMRQLPRGPKRGVVLVTDFLLCVAAVCIALMLRLERLDIWTATHIFPLIGSLAIFLPIFSLSGMYRENFRFGGWFALILLVKTVLIYGAVYATIFTIVGVRGVPRTIGILQPIIFLCLLGASRGVARYWLGGVHKDLHLRKNWPRVLIYGAGEAGQQLARALLYGRKMWLVGFLEDDARLQGTTLLGVPVYPASDLAAELPQLNVESILLAVPSASRKRRNEIVDMIRAVDSKVTVRMLPAVTDIAQGKVEVSQLRDVDVTDLLGRDPIPPDPDLLGRNITGKSVLVTGAGGSIGSELCRQILNAQPTVLILVEISEFALYAVHRELENLAAHAQLPVRLVPMLASVRDAKRMRKIMEAWQPQTVYHAAAYKHVPIVEHNPAEGIANNVFGTLLTARLAMESGVTDFVLISTDKAVRPTNVMGASKRLAEMTLQALATDHTARQQTRFTMVRFGNVLGSSGSVVPLFREQIRNGAAVTLTHKDITRYFMTIPEAAQLVIQAGAMTQGGDVFVLDMGQPVRIIDLARRMIELSGLSVQDDANPDGDIAIRITGLRPGEKLYEELLIGDNPQPTPNPRIMKAHEDFLPWPALQPRLDALTAAVQNNDVHAMRMLLQELVSGYQPAGEMVDWLHLHNGADTAQEPLPVLHAPTPLQ